jgi:hypothetical protein
MEKSVTNSLRKNTCSVDYQGYSLTFNGNFDSGNFAKAEYLQETEVSLGTFRKSWFRWAVTKRPNLALKLGFIFRLRGNTKI